MTRDEHHRQSSTAWKIGTAFVLMAIALLFLAILTGAPAASARTQQQTDPGCVYTGGGWICYGTLPPGSDVELTRLGGATRVETAAAIATYEPVEGETVLLIANGDTMVDAIAAGTKFTNTPLLLVRTGEVVPPATLEAASAISPDRVILLGGPDVVSDTQANTILYALVP